MAVTSYGDTITEAVATSYRAIEDIHFEGKTYRRDITRDLV